jgi:hypothetical protein
MNARSYLLLLVLWFSTCGLRAQNICQPFGNLVLFSNYDGGFLTIDVDEDIPDLTIGVVSYESVAIVVTGAYAGNVVRLVHAGFNATNGGCGSGSSAPTAITVDPGTEVISLFAPPVTVQSNFGHHILICAYSCSSTTNQGGCNTAEQAARFFQDNYGVLLRSHRVQYGCWTGVQTVSSGGNCCAGAITTGTGEIPSKAGPLRVDVTGAHIVVHGAEAFDVIDAAGRTVATFGTDGAALRTIPTMGWGPGTYLVRERATGRVARFGLVH